MKTYLPKESEIVRKWYVIDAEGKTVGRLAVQIANILRGRNKPTYTPHLDTGDHVIVLNAGKVVFSGDKDKKKIYQDYSGWMGGQKDYTAETIREKTPERIINQAVSGMMPNGRLGRKMFTKLKVYLGTEHDHVAQKPETLDI